VVIEAAEQRDEADEPLGGNGLRSRLLAAVVATLISAPSRDAGEPHDGAQYLASKP
jgi:hypothetical protein